MTDNSVSTGFMIDLVGDQEQIKKQLIGRPIHAAILCPQPNGSEEWAVSIVPFGRVISFSTEKGSSVTKVTIDLLHGEVDTI